MRTSLQSQRREFLKTMAVVAGSVSCSGLLCGADDASDDKLNLGFIGVGGRGSSNLQALASQNVVALCDVDDVQAQGAFAQFPNAKRYRDYREMLEKEKSLDAVAVSTPDHTHACAAIAAMRRGVHVYCEKPLAHSIYEVRAMRDEARKAGVVTQMGTQGHAMEGTRRAVEVVRSGAIGEVKELHVWTDRPSGWWPQGEQRPTETPPIPESLDWNLWLGPAPMRPYHPVYVPFKWRGRWDFGTGAIGDMGVHNLDTAFWALELGLPTSAELVDSDRKTEDCPPRWSIIEMYYPARGKHPAVKLTFYDGKRLPPAELFHGEEIPANGSLIIGSQGTLFTRTWNGGSGPDDMFMLLPRKEFLGYELPAASLPRTTSHHVEFIQACKGGPPTQSHFDYAATLTEGLLVGFLAIRTGKRIVWDSASMKAVGCPEADAMIHPNFRPGWNI